MRGIVMRLIILLLLLPSLAFAALPYRPELTAEPPTEYVSGEPLDPATEYAS